MVGSSCSPKDSQECSPALQFKNLNSSVLSFLYSPALTSIHNYQKNHSSDKTNLFKLLFDMLSRFAIAFLPKSKGLNFIKLQSLSAVILEPKRIKAATVSIFFLFAVK